MQARYYDPVIGRFLSVDPVTFMDNGNPAQFNRYSYTFNDPVNAIDPDGNETVFIGGAGDNGAYKADFVTALTKAGIQNVRSSSPPVSLGHMLFDAPGVITNNGDPGILLTKVPQLERKSNDSQYNLVGYSWGTTVAAQQAIASAVTGTPVDNLVLIGAPLNQSLMDRLANTEGIGNIHVFNLTAEGDPIHAGMSDLDLVKSVPTLVKQMRAGTGHFTYSSGYANGTEKLDNLAQNIKEKGLE